MYLPYADIRDTIRRLVKLSLHGHHPAPPTLEKADSWIDLLHRLPAEHAIVNPARFIARLAIDDAARMKFLFSIYLPAQYGGGFGRYPAQNTFLMNWLTDNIHRLPRPLYCLDAACGSGEGSYELVRALLESGVTAAEVRVTGVTISPLEIFAAAHACFPHSPERELRYREVVKQMADAGVLSGISFTAADLRDVELLPGCYHVIICNGILGGPHLHKREEVESLVARLADSLAKGGILLAADRFHAGWKKLLNAAEMENVFAGCGLDL
jgi:chemotaxis methyl-accepting protein methylase